MKKNHNHQFTNGLPNRPGHQQGTISSNNVELTNKTHGTTSQKNTANLKTIVESMEMQTLVKYSMNSVGINYIVNELSCNIFKESEIIENGKVTILQLLSETEEKFLLNFPKVEQELSRANPVSALWLRIIRFKLKFTVLKTILILQSPNSNLLLQKFNEILQRLKYRKVHVDFNNIPENGPTITFESTIKLITNELMFAEAQLRLLFTPILALYRITNESIDLPLHPSILQVLNVLAPPGLTNIEKDFYYIIRLLINNGHSSFTDLQKKQWLSLTVEIKSLLHFLFLYPPDQIPPLTLLMTDSSQLINLRFDKFSALSSISKNTYSRIINATTHFILMLYCTMLVLAANHKGVKVS